MSNFRPNLPEDNAKLVVMSTNNKELINRVEELGIKVLSSENLSKMLIFDSSPDT
jgi:rRNA-processing protein FCF1